MHHNNQTPLAAKKIDEELEESVEGEGFVDIAEGLDPEGDAEGDEGGPACGGEDGDEHEDADDVALEERFAVVFRLEEDGSMPHMLVGGGMEVLIEGRAYTIVSRHATRAHTPATIKTARPKPEPVPASSSCSPLVAMLFFQDMVESRSSDIGDLVKLT